MAIDAEYTITKPNISKAKVTHTKGWSKPFTCTGDAAVRVNSVPWTRTGKASMPT
jgi:hypothetical protein